MIGIIGIDAPPCIKEVVILPSVVAVARRGGGGVQHVEDVGFEVHCLAVLLAVGAGSGAQDVHGQRRSNSNNDDKEGGRWTRNNDNNNDNVAEAKTIEIAIAIAIARIAVVLLIFLFLRCIIVVGRVQLWRI